jgi:DNA-binding CsgD family transcriptional regulator
MTTNLNPAIRTWLSSLPIREAGAPPAAQPPAAVALTPRELEVLHLLAAGCTYARAAARLGVSPHTVVTHIKNAYRKLDVHSAAAAVMRVVELGLFQKAGTQ